MDEGSSFHLSLASPSDPSSADTTAGFTYAFDCGDGSGYGAFSATHTATCPTTDNGTRTVRAKVKDKDGGTTEYTGTVTVANVAPTATFSNDGPVDEGSSFHLSLSSPSDPSSADTSAGFTYAFDCGDGSGYGAFAADASATCSTSDNGTLSVEAKIRDKDGGIAAYSDAVTVGNVAPTGTFSTDSPVDEGSSFHLSLTSPSDPSSADTTAGFSYAFDCGDGSGYSTFSADATAACPTSDNGTLSVSAKIRDKDGGTTAYSDTVTVRNVAPTATFSNDGPVDEGSSFHLSLTDSSDPSSADTTAGLTYAFDCGDSSGYSTFSPDATAACPTSDDGTRSVKAKIRDKDGGTTEYTDAVTVTNVAPTATFGNDGPVDEGSSFHLSLTNPSDPSSADTSAGFTYAFDCGDGTGYGTFSATPPPPAQTSDDGTRSVKAKIRDKDGGTTEYTDTVTVRNVAPTATFSNDGPVDEGSSFHLSLTDPSDPSSADTTAGFTYAFDCGDGSGYGAFSS